MLNDKDFAEKALSLRNEYQAAKADYRAKRDEWHKADIFENDFDDKEDALNAASKKCNELRIAILTFFGAE